MKMNKNARMVVFVLEQIRCKPYETEQQETPQNVGVLKAAYFFVCREIRSESQHTAQLHMEPRQRCDLQVEFYSTEQTSCLNKSV